MTREDPKQKCGTCHFFKGEKQACGFGFKVESYYNICEHYIPLAKGVRRIIRHRGFGFVLCVIVLVVLLIAGILLGGIISIVAVSLFIFGLFALIFSGLCAGQRWWERGGGSRDRSPPRVRLTG